MKTTLNFLLVLIFSLTLPHQAAAYVFSTKKDYVQTVAPPQYPLKKMSFLERIIAKHAAKKLKKSGDLILDIELVAHRAQGFGIASLVAFLGIFLFMIAEGFVTDTMNFRHYWLILACVAAQNRI